MRVLQFCLQETRNNIVRQVMRGRLELECLANLALQRPQTGRRRVASEFLEAGGNFLRWQAGTNKPSEYGESVGG